MTSRTISCWLASGSSLQAASKASLIRPITSGSKNTPGRIGNASTSPTRASPIATVLRARGQSYVDCTLCSRSRNAFQTFASASWPSHHRFASELLIDNDGRGRVRPKWDRRCHWSGEGPPSVRSWPMRILAVKSIDVIRSRRCSGLPLFQGLPERTGVERQFHHGLA